MSLFHVYLPREREGGTWRPWPAVPTWSLGVRAVNWLWVTDPSALAPKVSFRLIWRSCDVTGNWRLVNSAPHHIIIISKSSGWTKNTSHVTHGIDEQLIVVSLIRRVNLFFFFQASSCSIGWWCQQQTKRQKHSKRSATTKREKKRTLISAERIWAHSRPPRAQSWLRSARSSRTTSRANKKI